MRESWSAGCLGLKNIGYGEARMGVKDEFVAAEPEDMQGKLCEQVSVLQEFCAF